MMFWIGSVEFASREKEGATVRLSDLRGKPVVLYFYPKDDTPGCTKQDAGCAMRMPTTRSVER